MQFVVGKIVEKQESFHTATNSHHYFWRPCGDRWLVTIRVISKNRPGRIVTEAIMPDKPKILEYIRLHIAEQRNPK